MFVDILNAMKRISLLLAIVAAVSTVSAQDIVVEGNLCENVNLKFKYNLWNRYDSFVWNFGDGSTDKSVDPSHKYEAGTYTIKLTATKTTGESITESKTITINAIPDIDFSYDTTEQHNVLAFKADLGATHYKWSFGDDNIKDTTDTEITHKYSAPGTYEVKLIASDDNGCADTTIHSVKVNPSRKLPNIIVPNSIIKENRYFMISCNEGSRLKLEIFNRWGYKMFSRTGTENIVWDGYNPQGTLVAPGTYFYVITVEEGSTDYNPLNGYITVYY